MQTKKQNPFPVKRLVLNAVLVAIYVVLGYLRIPIGNAFRISMAPFAVIMAALVFGPTDGLIVGFVGEFLTQILGPYGLTQTTLLWCIGETVRGGALGLCSRLFLKWLPTCDRPSGRQIATLLTCSCATGVLAALGQTFALYVDSTMLGYYNETMVFGLLIWRIVIYIVVSALLGYLCMPIITALRKTKLV
ncbi:MAG: ECF transporter S component [Oscillospiraceae bacterium]|nr:ECF transporter S component [Oscillospiraceae bacterium]